MHDIGTPPGEARDDRLVLTPQSDNDMLSVDRYVLARAIMGADMSEVLGPEKAKQISALVVKTLNKDIMEVYSPERVAAMCKDFGLRQGASLDLTNGFDFDTYADRKRAWEILEEDKPLLVIGSPPCTYFSMLYELNKHIHGGNADWMRRYDENLKKAKRHVAFCAKIYKHQIDNNRYFLHEHPWLAKSWSLDCIKEIEAMRGVVRIRLDMCQFGMTSHWDKKDGPIGPVLKPTGMLTNSWCLQLELAKRCPRDHEHVHLVGGRAAAAQEYPRELCESICRGLAAQKKADLSTRFTTLPMNAERVVSLSMLCCEATGGPLSNLFAKDWDTFAHRDQRWIAHDSVGSNGTADSLIGNGVEETNKSVAEVIDSSLLRKGDPGKSSWPSFLRVPIGDFSTHWGDGMHDGDGHGLRSGARDLEGEVLLKGELAALMIEGGIEYASDDVSGAHLQPELVHEARKVEMKFFEDMTVYERVDRSEMLRRGGKIIKTRWIDVNQGDASCPNYRSRLVGKEYKTHVDDSLYASTPPLEALRPIMSRAATTDDHHRELMINDVRRAYFYAKATRELYVELPAEDREYAKGDKVGRLRLCLYGTRDAALNWQDTLSEHLLTLGYKRGVGFPSVFVHEQRDLWTLVHGDDYPLASSSKQTRTMPN